MSRLQNGPDAKQSTSGGLANDADAESRLTCRLSLDDGQLVVDVGGLDPQTSPEGATVQLLCNGDLSVSVANSHEPQIRFAPTAPGYYQAVALISARETGTIRTTSNLLAHNVTLSSLDDFLSLTKAQTVTRVAVGPWDLPVMTFPNTENCLFVLLHAAIDRDRTPVPTFERWTWAKRGVFPGHVLCVSDPTLELSSDLRLGWYFGTIEKDATASVVDLAKAYAVANGIPNDKIVFWGSSGGGFAALAAANRLPGSIAVAVNPQVDVQRYHLRAAVDKFNHECLAGIPEDELPTRVLQRTDMHRAWTRNLSSRAWLIANVADEDHFEAHFAPFWSFLGGQLGDGWTSAERHKAWIYEDPSGHAPESLDMANEIVSRLPFIRAEQAGFEGQDEGHSVSFDGRSDGETMQLAVTEQERIAAELAEVSLLAASRHLEILSLRRSLVEAKSAETTRLERSSRTIRRLRRKARRARRRGESRVRGTIRYQIGDLIVGSVRRPWKLLTLPIRVVSVATSRRSERKVVR